MSETTAGPAATSQNRRGTIVVSVLTSITFQISLIAVSYLYWVTKDPVVLAILGALVGVVSTNFTNTVGYWTGSSVGSDKKTDILATPGNLLPPAPSLTQAPRQ